MRSARWLLLLTMVACAQTPPPPDPDECAVWRRELSFAMSVENHDANAFASHLDPGAVFGAGTESPIRGRDAVLKAWAGLIAGGDTRLRWRPRYVSIGADRNIAFSQGPFVLEDKRPDGTPRFRVGTFSSVWIRRAGKWVVLFDGGATPAEVKDAQAAEAHLVSAPAACPSR